MGTSPFDDEECPCEARCRGRGAEVVGAFDDVALSVGSIALESRFRGRPLSMQMKKKG